MSQVSKHPIRKDVYDRIFELLTKIVTDSHNQQETQELLEDLFTPSEKIVLSKRLAVAVLLTKGYTYQEVQDILHLSKESVAKISTLLKYGGNGYRSFALKILKEEKMDDFWNKAVDTLLSVGAEGNGYGTGVWKYLRSEVKKKQKGKHTSI